MVVKDKYSYLVYSKICKTPQKTMTFVDSVQYIFEVARLFVDQMCMFSKSFHIWVRITLFL